MAGKSPTLRAPEWLNLSRRPFVNTRPVGRVALLLWLGGAALLAVNVTLFWGYVSSSEETAASLEEVERRTESERQRIAALDRELAGLDLERQNEKVAFLNGKIAERAFSWSLLFDRIAEVLPDDVRLTRLAPRPLRDARRPAGQPSPLPAANRGSGGVAAALEDDRVQLSIDGVARKEEALYQFMDNLFAHPAFGGEPNLSRESRDSTQQIEFDIQAVYHAGSEAPAEPSVVVEEEEVPGAAGGNREDGAEPGPRAAPPAPGRVP